MRIFGVLGVRATYVAILRWYSLVIGDELILRRGN